MPISSAARITRVPLGTRDLDVVDGQRDQVVDLGLAPRSGVLVVDGHARAPAVSAKRVEAAGSNGQPPSVEVRDVLVAEVLDRRRDRAGRAVAERAERPAEDVVAQVEQLVEVAPRCPRRARAGAGSAPATRCPRGTACTCRRTRACRTRSSAAPRGRRRWSRRRSAAPWCRASTRPRHALVVERDVEVLGGEQRRGRAARRPELQLVALADAAGQVEQLAQRDAQRRLVLAGPRDVPGQRVQREALATSRCPCGEPVGAVAR